MNDQLITLSITSLPRKGLDPQIVVAGRSAEICVYDLPIEQGLYWAERGDGELMEHLWDDHAGADDNGYQEYIASNPHQLRYGRDRFLVSKLRGVRVEHGFQVMYGDSDSSLFDLTHDALKSIQADIEGIVPIDQFKYSSMWFNEQDLPRHAILVTQSNTIGQVNYALDVGGQYDPGLLSFETETHDGWPLVTGAYYDSKALNQISEQTRLNGVPHTNLYLYR